MSSIDKYELLKREGLLIDRVKYILSLSDKTEMEIYLKTLSVKSYNDLQMLILLYKSTKNQMNLIEIFKTDSLPVRQRADAGKAWLRLQTDEKKIHQFVVETIIDVNIPRLIKHQILKYLHHIHCLKISLTFFYDLAHSLTQTFHHDEFNIDAHTLPFCSKDQIIKLLSQWSITSYNQISFSTSFSSKLIRYQPLIVIQLINNDLIHKHFDNNKMIIYWRKNKKLFELLVKKEPKAICRLAIEYISRLENHERILPAFIFFQQKHLFNKASNEMIELITLVASYQPGIIKYETSWDYSGIILGSFSFPHSFSIENYIRLFFVLYDTCNWSINNSLDVVVYMLSNDVNIHEISFLRKRRKWFFDMIIQERIGKQEFVNELLKHGSEIHLRLFKDFPELRIPLAQHTLQQLIDQSNSYSLDSYASFLSYGLMNLEIFNKFLSILQQNGSNLSKRKHLYTLIFQCAISTDQENVNHVLQWIQKRFINEQLTAIEYFLQHLSSENNRCYLEYLPDNFQAIETIMNIAFNHLQRTSDTLEIILTYGFFLLVHLEHYQDRQQQEKIQEFASKIFKEYYIVNTNFPNNYQTLPESSSIACNVFANILISDIFPKLISKCCITEIINLLIKCFDNMWCLTQIDKFIYSFFFEYLINSVELQSIFDIDEHSVLISLLLSSRSTRLERVDRLLNEIDYIFFLDIEVQEIILQSQQYRQLIDKLLEDEKCINATKLSKQQVKTCLKITNKKIPGFHLKILNNYYNQLTGQQQEYIIKIILNDYLQDTEIPNPEKLKAVRVLRRFSHMYQNTLELIEKNQDAFLLRTIDTTSTTIKSIRGANIQTINYYILSLPATFDLFPQDLWKQFDRLKTQLNSSNATYIKDAFLSISRKMTDESFLKHYIEFIRTEHFGKFGITANKAILRLLIQYRFNTSLITSILKPLWDSHPHPDIRACLIKILLHFIHKSNVNEDHNELEIWSILEQAAHDDYRPVVYALFGFDGKGSCRTLSGLEGLSSEVLEIFVRRIQMKILDHPTSINARIWAWCELESEYCNINIVIDKARQLCLQFDNDANDLWKLAFKKILLFYKLKKISCNDVVNFIESIIYHDKDIDLNQNDVHTYHRMNELLDLFISSIGKIDDEQRQCFRTFALSILQFEITMALLVGKLLMKLARSRDDLEEMLTVFQSSLSPVYFEHVIINLESYLNANDGSCPYVQQLNIEEKFDFAQWCINKMNIPLFVFDLLKNQIFNKASIDKQQCQILLRQMRQSQNLLLRQKALQYKVPWKQDGTMNNDN
ncbi:unnamed protein product [Adineta steineri]|uniref:Uncharacterized protein n=1 Tax=Adineta steineri TaxID=433720 RepID=A0A815ZEC7_9BILA|nr:unnamed protein product [Adineta steineri]CAF1581435.1 unnamed protein product [Adineta steineri]